MRRNRFCLYAIAIIASCISCTPSNAAHRRGIQAKGLPQVEGVDAQPLLAQVKRLQEAMKYR